MATALQIADLRFEHHPTGLGVPFASPRLSWRFEAAPGAAADSWMQTSYDVEIKRVPGKASQIFSCKGSTSVLVPWPDKPLESRETASVRVKSHGTAGGDRSLDTEWSEWITVEAALLQRQDWTAKAVIAPPRTDERHADERGLRPVRFRKVFEAPPTVGSARLYITALGLYEAFLNGTRIGDECLAPGWTAYQGRIQYQVFDVTPLLQAGTPNILSAEVAEGWYAGRLTWDAEVSCLYGDRLGLLAQLEVVSASPEAPVFRVVSDETWECMVSPIVASGIYDGETYDLGLEVSDWATEGSWTGVETLAFPRAELIASSCPAVRVTETIKPVGIWRDPDGATLVDFGQNLVGKLSIASLSGPNGHRLRIRHAEVLEHGRLGVRPLRSAKQTDTVIFGADRPLRDWSPSFTYHGFRYVELQGWPGDGPTVDSLSALVMHTDMRRTGFFECSNEELNQLHRNVTWGMRGNFVSIPTDCPQRDERLGWTGDIQVFGTTASYLYDCNGMLGNWLRDVIIDQRECGGIVPLVVPNALKSGLGQVPVPQAVWDDAIILVPWMLYTRFGDAGVLHDTYPGMQAYLKTVRRGGDGLWSPDLWQLGDWLDPNAPPDDPGMARTDGVLVADAYLVHVTEVMARVAAVLALPEDSKRYAAEAKRLRGLFQDKYVTRAGLVVGDSQTALALAIVFRLHDEPAQAKAAGERLARLVRYSKFRVSTGFAGTPAILHALSQAGHPQLAYRMLLEPGCPSWLYPVRMGATTVWERWDSMLADGTINPGEMTSFNHYALGSVADWMHATIGGIVPLEPGWRRFWVRPQPGGGITSAKVDFLGPQGAIRARWTVEHDVFSLSLTVPPNSTAVVALPDGSSKEEVVGSGDHSFKCKLGREATENWPPQPLLTGFQSEEEQAPQP